MTAMLRRLEAWRATGWLRALPLAFARFVQEQDAQLPSSLLLAAAALAQLEGLGHSVLPLSPFASEAQEILGWPVEAAPELAEALAGWPADAAAASRAWAGHGALQIEPADDGGSSPMVLCGGLLYLRRHWRHESQVLAQVLARSRIDASANFDVAREQAELDRLFPMSGPAPDAQKLACAQALRARLTLLTGGPGTGKTYTAARLLLLLQALHDGAQPLRVALAAPTGKAAARLRQSIAAALPADVPLPPARTLHALLGTRPGSRRFGHDAGHLLEVDLLFVDEASMVHLEMMAALLQALPTGARLVLLGDKDQLASVEAGAVLGELCRGGVDDSLARQTMVLRESRRFAGAIGRLAEAVNAGDGDLAVALLRDGAQAEVSWLQAGDAASVAARAASAYQPYLETLAQRPAAATGFEGWVHQVLGRFDSFRVLCALRQGPWGVASLNFAIENGLQMQGLRRRGEWYEGRPVMVTRNEASLGVFNGDIGIVLAAPGSGRWRVYFADGDTLRSVAVGRLADLETAFAMTVHKSQGSEFAQVMLVLPEEDSPVITRELVYTGITRARHAFTLAAVDASRLARACRRLTRRLSGLHTLRERAASWAPEAQAGGLNTSE